MHARASWPAAPVPEPPGDECCAASGGRGCGAHVGATRSCRHLAEHQHACGWVVSAGAHVYRLPWTRYHALQVILCWCPDQRYNVITILAIIGHVHTSSMQSDDVRCSSCWRWRAYAWGMACGRSGGAHAGNGEWGRPGGRQAPRARGAWPPEAEVHSELATRMHAYAGVVAAVSPHLAVRATTTPQMADCLGWILPVVRNRRLRCGSLVL